MNEENTTGYWIKQSWALLLFALVFGLLSALYPKEFPLWPRILLGEIAVAFVVAWILIITAERKHKQRSDNDFADRQRVLSRNIFDYIYGVKVPPELWKFVEKNIIESKFYRSNVRVDYTFEKDTVAGGFKVWANVSYRVTNLTDASEDFLCKGTIEKPHGNLPVGEQLGLQKINIDGENLSAAAMKKAKSARNDTEDFFALRHREPIPGNAHKEFKLTYMMRKKDCDYELWRCIEPCEGISVRINGPSNLKIKLRAIHPNRDFDFIDRDGNNGRVHVEIQAPLLPQNGVLFWWDEEPCTEPVPNPEAAAAVAAAPKTEPKAA